VVDCDSRSHSQESRHEGTPVLEMRNIAKAFGKFYALKGVDLTVWPGEIHA
jgi:ribose transport system ATP-binding protein